MEHSCSDLKGGEKQCRDPRGFFLVSENVSEEVH